MANANIDIGGLSALEVREALSAAAAARTAKLQADKEQQRILEDADFLAEWWSHEGRNRPPIVRAHVYGNDFDMAREISGFVSVRDPRRPVVMRGSMYFMVKQHAKTPFGDCPNGLAEDIAHRYLRRIKYTSFDVKEHREFMTVLHDALSEKFRLTWHFNKPEFGMCWLNGTSRWDLTNEQVGYLKRLDGIRRKLKRIDKTGKSQ